jgi:hypothetical protein
VSRPLRPTGIYRRSTGRDRPTDGVFKGVGRDGIERVVRRMGGPPAAVVGTTAAAGAAARALSSTPANGTGAWVRHVVTAGAEYPARGEGEQACSQQAAWAAQEHAQGRGWKDAPPLALAQASQQPPQQAAAQAADASVAATAAAIAAAVHLLQQHQSQQQREGDHDPATAPGAPGGDASAWALPAAIALLTGASAGGHGSSGLVGFPGTAGFRSPFADQQHVQRSCAARKQRRAVEAVGPQE